MADPRRALGESAEDAALVYLTGAGLRVVARNVRFPEGELDLVCRDGEVWVFVEVKCRHQRWGDSPAAAVERQKQRRLVRLAEHWLKWRQLRDVRCRFDVVAVTLLADGHRQIRHLRDAFSAG